MVYLMNPYLMAFAWSVIGMCAVGMFALGCVVIYGIYAEIYHLIYKMKRGL